MATYAPIGQANIVFGAFAGGTPHAPQSTASIVFAPSGVGLKSIVKPASSTARIVFDFSGGGVKTKWWAATGNAVISFGGSGTGSHGNTLLAGPSTAKIVFVPEADACDLANGVTVRHGVNSILSLWGQISTKGDTPEKGEAVGFLNAAMQRLHESGKDYGFVARTRRFYNGYLPVSSVALEEDVQHVDGNVVFMPVAGYWSIPLANGDAITNGGSITAFNGTGATILAGGSFKTALQTLTGLIGEGVSSLDVLRLYVPGGSGADNPPLKNTSGAHLDSAILFYDSPETIPFWPPYITWVETTKTVLRALDSNASVQATRARLANSVYVEYPTVHRPVAYAVRTSPSRTAVTGVLGTGEVIATVQNANRGPALEIELVPAASYIGDPAPINGGPAAPGSPTAAGARDRWELQVDVVIEPPRFSCCDVDSGRRIPVPNRYAESLVIPLARYYALSARYRVSEATIAAVKAQAAEALALIGEVDPRVKDVQENRRDTSIKS